MGNGDVEQVLQTDLNVYSDDMLVSLPIFSRVYTAKS